MSSSKQVVNITLAASEIHSLVIQDQFESYNSVLRKLWKKTNPESYRKALSRNRTADPDEEDQKAINGIISKLEDSNAINDIIKEKNIQEATKRMNNIINEINNVVKEDSSTKDKTVKAVQKTVNMTRGALNKNQLLDKYEEEIEANSAITVPTHVIIRATNKYIKTITFESKKFIINVSIIGKPCITNTNIIVMPKSRQYKLFDEVKNYDNVTAQVYMFLTDNTCTHLIEEFNKEVLIHSILYDEDYWKKTIEYAIGRTGKKISNIINEKDAQDRLLINHE
jgi:hypothetical protein